MFLVLGDGAAVGSEELYRIGTQLFTGPLLYKNAEVLRGTIGSFAYGSGIVGGVVKLEVETAPLQRWYVEHAAVETVDDTVRAFVTDSWHLAVQLLKVFHASRTSLTLIQGSSVSSSRVAVLTLKWG